MEKEAKRKKETKIELTKLQEKESTLDPIDDIFYTFRSRRYPFFFHDMDKFNTRFIFFQPPI